MTITITDITKNLQFKWWLGNGVDPNSVIAVWHGVENVSQARSYVNLVNEGTYDLAAGTVPSWSTALGWTFNGTNQYLTTGITPTGGNYTVIALGYLAAPISTSGDYIMGIFNVIGGNYGIKINFTPQAGAVCRISRDYQWGNFNNIVNTDFVTPTYYVVALAGDIPYYTDTNDILQSPGAIGGAFGTTSAVYFGAANNAGSPLAGSYFGSVIQAMAIYNTQLDQAAVASVAANLLALNNTTIVKPNYITIHPNTRRLAQRNHILLCALDYGVYQTQDGGNSWIKFELPDPSNAEFLDSPVATVNELTFNWVDYDPTNYDTIYILGQKSSVNRQWLYKSTDKGINWTSRGIVAT